MVWCLLKQLPPGWETVPGSSEFSLIADYTLTKIRNFTPDKRGFYDHIDVNGDGVNDFRMVYSTGDQQIFYAVKAI